MSGRVKFYYKLTSGDKILSSVIENGWCASNFFFFCHLRGWAITMR